MSKKEKKVLMPVYVSPGQKERLEAVAEKHDVTVAFLVRRLIKRELERVDADLEQVAI